MTIQQKADGFYFNEFGPYTTEQGAEIARILTSEGGIYVDEILAGDLLAFPEGLADQWASDLL